MPVTLCLPLLGRTINLLYISIGVSCCQAAVIVASGAQVGSAPQLWTYQGTADAHWEIYDATSLGDGIYLTLSSNKNQEGAANVGTTKVMTQILPTIPVA